MTFHWNLLNPERNLTFEADTQCVHVRCRQIQVKNKKVLLHECKRHTTRRVVSTPSVVWHTVGCTRTSCRQIQVKNKSWGGTLYLPVLTWQGTPPAGPGWVPPPRCHLPHRLLTNVAKHYGMWVQLDLAGFPPTPWHNVAKHYGIWVSPPRCEQTNKVKLLPSRADLLGCIPTTAHCSPSDTVQWLSGEVSAKLGAPPPTHSPYPPRNEILICHGQLGFQIWQRRFNTPPPRPHPELVFGEGRWPRRLHVYFVFVSNKCGGSLIICCHHSVGTGELLIDLILSSVWRQ